MSKLTLKRLKEALHYDPTTGLFTWLISAGSAVKGSLAGSEKSDGYIEIGLDKSVYRAHRLAWLYTTGSCPKDQIDHVDGDRSNNRIANLREATPTQNQWNRAKSTNNTSGFKGVSWHKRRLKYQAHISRGSLGRKTLGFFDTPEEAYREVLRAQRKLHKEFQRR